jgi:ketosteroid isomerase-like protein
MRLRLRLAAILLLILWPPIFSVAQQKSDAASKVLAAEAKWNEAYKRNDVGALNSLLADDFIITVEDGSTFSKAGYIAYASEGVLRVEISEMSNLKVILHGDVAIVTGAYHEKGTTKGKPYEYHDRLTDVWLNTDGKWQLIAAHYSIPVK